MYILVIVWKLFIITYNSVAIVTGMAAGLLQLFFHKIIEKALAILSKDMIFLLTAQIIIKVLVFEVC